jgi:hypothetical protein
MKVVARCDRPVQVEHATGQVRPNLFVVSVRALTSPVQQQKSQFIALITDASGRLAEWLRIKASKIAVRPHHTVTADVFLLCLR